MNMSTVRENGSDEIGEAVVIHRFVAANSLITAVLYSLISLALYLVRI